MSQGHVFLIEDDHGLRASLRDLLGFAGYQVRVWEDAASFLNELPAVAPAVVVTDMRMPGLSGVEMHAELTRRGRVFPVIYLSGESTVPQTVQAMKLGAFDFLTKPFSREQLLGTVAAALEHDRIAMHSLIRKAKFEEALAHLSPRERQVHALLLKGYGNRELIEALGISLPTAKQYKAEVMRKLGARSLAELMAHKTGETPGSVAAG
jgi:two-component system response regulator FixJ